MSKEIAVGMLKIAKNGNDLLQILDAIESSDCAADDGRGQDLRSWMMLSVDDMID